MENFTSYNPTKLLFGKNCVDKLGKEASKYGKKALILIGKGSVKSNGILDTVINQLNNNGVEYTLFEGIKSNPIYQDADLAVQQAKDFKAEMIIAVGGGSVLDSAKAIAVGYYVNHSVWEFYQNKSSRAFNALPILAVLTLAATGSEMNPYTVIQDTEKGIKASYGSPLLYPKVSFLDPSYTFSVPNSYKAYGVADLISHTLEQFFDPSSAPLSDYFATDIIRLAFEYGKKILDNPEDYEAHANVMWLATVALNGSLDAGKRGGDWGVHAVEHTLSVLFDVAHGAGLSIVYPAWLRYFKKEIARKLDFLAMRILGNDAVGEEFIQRLEQFYNEIGTPIRLSQIKVEKDKHELILENLKLNRANGAFFKMNDEVYQELISLMA